MDRVIDALGVILGLVTAVALAVVFLSSPLWITAILIASGY